MILLQRRASCDLTSCTIPFGEANIVRDGDDVTVVALARMVHYADEAIYTLAKEGIECELIDPRTTSPLDEETILESVERTLSARLARRLATFARCALILAEVRLTIG